MTHWIIEQERAVIDTPLGEIRLTVFPSRSSDDWAWTWTVNGCGQYRSGHRDSRGGAKASATRAAKSIERLARAGKTP